jgi:3'-5' exonuclease
VSKVDNFSVISSHPPVQMLWRIKSVQRTGSVAVARQFLTAKMVNGSSFDLPVLRYRALVHGVAAPGLSARPYFHRYTEDAVDLCDPLSSFYSQCKATLHELCRVMGLPASRTGSTARMWRGTIAKDAFGRSPSTARAMSSTPIASGYGMNYFEGGLSGLEFEASEAGLVDFIKARGNTKPHLAGLM